MDGMIGDNKKTENCQVKGAIIGFRVWNVKKNKLVSPHNLNKWNPGVNTAKCKKINHKLQKEMYIKSGILGTSIAYKKVKVIPKKECTCGLYSYLRTPYHPIYPYEVLGATLNWGIIEMHSTGMRAQYSLPILICGDNKNENARNIADIYNLKIVDYINLEQEASLLGQVAASKNIDINNVDNFFL